MQYIGINCKGLTLVSEFVNIHSAAQGLLATDLVILNHNQVTRMTPELAPLPSHSSHITSSGGRLSQDTFNIHWPPLHGGSSVAPGLELMTRQPRVHYLDHKTTEATNLTADRIFVFYQY
ncbi:hypothetical protein TNCV_1903341 [Trichonephila clavipes]|nr:hypothetical protein TNCV_1903341 [Trichonephila clavipes]